MPCPPPTPEDRSPPARRVPAWLVVLALESVFVGVPAAGLLFWHAWQREGLPFDFGFSRREWRWIGAQMLFLAGLYLALRWRAIRWKNRPADRVGE